MNPGGKRRLLKDQEDVEDRPLGCVGLLVDDFVWLVFVQPSKGPLKGAVLIYRLELNNFPDSAPSWSGLSFVPTDFFEKVTAQWTATQSLREYLEALRNHIQHVELEQDLAERIVKDTKEVFASQFGNAVFIPSMEVEALQQTVKRKPIDSDRRAFLTASQLFSMSSSNIGISMSTSGIVEDDDN